jgi:hypothetical protein
MFDCLIFVILTMSKVIDNPSKAYTLKTNGVLVSVRYQDKLYSKLLDLSKIPHWNETLTFMPDEDLIALNADNKCVAILDWREKTIPVKQSEMMRLTNTEFVYADAYYENKYESHIENLKNIRYSPIKSALIAESNNGDELLFHLKRRIMRADYSPLQTFVVESIENLDDATHVVKDAITYSLMDNTSFAKDCHYFAKKCGNMELAKLLSKHT